MIQPEIPAGALLLRPWRRSDASAVVAAWADPEIRRWARYGAKVPGMENIEQWVDWNNQQWQFGLRAGFAICSAETGELAGSITMRDYGKSPAVGGHGGDTGETGYWIVPAWRGRGAAGAALSALTNWAFAALEDDGLGLRRVELRHSVQNKASCRVAEKAGFLHEGTLRESFRYADGAWHDEHIHARLVGDEPVQQP